MKIDLTILGGSRPKLLKRTLQSFHEKIFVNFEISSVYANLDLFGGHQQDRLECIKILNTFFLNPEIACPDSNSFGLAVKNLWLQPKSDTFLHLEDDWLAISKIEPIQISKYLKGKTKQIALHHGAFHSYFRNRFHWSKHNTFGYEVIPNFSRPIFSTSPSFLNSNFALSCAELMDPGMDPEKQLSNGSVARLSEFTSKYRCRLLKKNSGMDYVQDIGRDWRELRGINKTFEDGASIWTNDV